MRHSSKANLKFVASADSTPNTGEGSIAHAVSSVDLFIGQDCWARIDREGDDLSLDVKSRGDGQAWRMSVSELQAALTGARDLLGKPK